LLLKAEVPGVVRGFLNISIIFLAYVNPKVLMGSLKKCQTKCPAGWPAIANIYKKYKNIFISLQEKLIKI